MIKKIFFFVLILLALFALGLFIYNRIVLTKLQKLESQLKSESEDGVVKIATARTLKGTKQPGKIMSACLLVHGYMSSPLDFGDLPETLAMSGFHVRVMRLPGHAQTPSKLSKVTEQEFTNAVKAEYSALRKQFATVYVVGFSFGGTLSTLLASENDVAGLVLVAPHYKITYKLRYFLPAETWASMFSPIMPFCYKSRSNISVFDEEGFKRLFTYRIFPLSTTTVLSSIGKRTYKQEVLSKVKCPALFVHSRKDDTSSIESSKQAFDWLGTDSESKEFFELTKSNHILLLDYERDEAIKRISEFLTKLDSSKGNTLNP